jgi:hypothetical protein
MTKMYELLKAKMIYVAAMYCKCYTSLLLLDVSNVSALIHCAVSEMISKHGNDKEI